MIFYYSIKIFFIFCFLLTYLALYSFLMLRILM